MPAIPLRVLEGKYEILEKIREGGMGAIYKVRHRLLDEVRVIKLMRPQFVDDPEFQARFVREARAAIRLRHPNIAHLYDFTLDDDGTAFIVIEFIAGKTLEDLLKTVGPPPLGLALEIAQQSLRALAYLHDKGFVHRDISPDNLMLTEDTDGNPQIKLIDLGIAKLLGAADSHLTRTGTFLGKVWYASPEQFSAEGAPSADARGDLYSFGVVLYELLTGVYPITGSDPQSIIAGHLFRPPIPFAKSDPAGRVPRGLRAVILKALAKSPHERHASAKELAGELASFRKPHDVQIEDWRSVLAHAAAASETARPGEPGSTQDRLDERFVLAATPPPSALRGEPDDATLPPAGGDAQAAVTQIDVRPLLAEAQRLIAREDFAAATEMLQRAQAYAPHHPDLPRLLAAVRAGIARGEDERRRAFEAAVRDVEGALAEGDLRTAEARLDAAKAEFGDQRIFESLHGRLARDGQIARLAESARQRADAGDLDGALAELGRARDLAPERGDLAASMAETEAALARQTAEKERRREAKVGRRAAEIGKRLEGGDLDGGAALLDKAVAELGEEGAFGELRSRLEALRAEAQARRRSDELSQAVAGLSARLDREELTEASKLLDAAVVRFGASPALREQWERLEELRLQALARQVEKLLGEARQLAAAGDATMARERLEQARRVDAASPELSGAAAEIEAALARQAAERRRAEDLAQAEAAVEAHLQREETGKAANVLAAAVAAHGEVEALRRLRARIQARQRAEELLREAHLLLEVEDFEDARRKLLQALDLVPGHAAAQELLELARRGLRRPAPPRGLATRRDARHAPAATGEVSASPTAPRPAPTGPQAPGPAASRPEPASSQVALPPPQATAPRPVVGARAIAGLAVAAWWAVARTAGRHAPATAGITLALAGLVVAGAFLSHRGSARPELQPGPAVAADTAAVVPTAGGAAPVQTGRLIVDAQPWGELVEARDEHGSAVSVPVGATTPFVLSLPPGHYTIVLRNPAFAGVTRVSADVQPGGEAGPVVARIGEVDADEFLQRMGLTR